MSIFDPITNAWNSISGKTKVTPTARPDQPMPSYGSNGAEGDIGHYRDLGNHFENAPQLDQGAADQSRGIEYGGLAQLSQGAQGWSPDEGALANAINGYSPDMQNLTAAASGAAPSQAELLGKSMEDQAIRSQVSAAGNVRGGPGAQAAAFRYASGNAMLQRAQMNQGIQAERAGEMATARGQLSNAMTQARGTYANDLSAGRGQFANAASGVRAQDLGAAEQNANLQQQTQSQNLANQRYFEGLAQQTKNYATDTAMQRYGAQQAQLNTDRGASSGEQQAGFNNLLTVAKAASGAASGGKTAAGYGSSSSGSSSDGPSTTGDGGDGGGGGGGDGGGMAHGGYAHRGSTHLVGEEGPEAVVMGSLGPLAWGVPRREEGGPLAKGQVGLVGEKGPELVKFNHDATVIPAPQTAQMMAGDQHLWQTDQTGPLDSAGYSVAKQEDTTRPSLSGPYTGPGAARAKSEPTATQQPAKPAQAAAPRYRPRQMTPEELMAAADALSSQMGRDHASRMAAGPAVNPVYREEGGPVAAGQPAVVGEKGPEAIVVAPPGPHPLPDPPPPPVDNREKAVGLYAAREMPDHRTAGRSVTQGRRHQGEVQVDVIAPPTTAAEAAPATATALPLPKPPPVAGQAPGIRHPISFARDRAGSPTHPIMWGPLAALAAGVPVAAATPSAYRGR